MKQGYNDRMDDSLGNRDGKKSSKEQNYKDRRDEAKAMNKAKGKRAYQSVESMDKNSFDKTWAKFKADTKKAFGGDKFAEGGGIPSKIDEGKIVKITREDLFGALGQLVEIEGKTALIDFNDYKNTKHPSLKGVTARRFSINDLEISNDDEYRDYHEMVEKINRNRKDFGGDKYGEGGEIKNILKIWDKTVGDKRKGIHTVSVAEGDKEYNQLVFTDIEDVHTSDEDLDKFVSAVENEAKDKGWNIYANRSLGVINVYKDAYAKGGGVEYFTMKDGSKISKDEWYKGMEDKLGFEKFAERILKDSQFGRTTSMPKNEFKHNSNTVRATIEDDFVFIDHSPKGIKENQSGEMVHTFADLRKLTEFLQREKIYAHGGKMASGGGVNDPYKKVDKKAMNAFAVKEINESPKDYVEGSIFKPNLSHNIDYDSISNLLKDSDSNLYKESKKLGLIGIGFSDPELTGIWIKPMEFALRKYAEQLNTQKGINKLVSKASKDNGNSIIYGLNWKGTDREEEETIYTATTNMDFDSYQGLYDFMFELANLLKRPKNNPLDIGYKIAYNGAVQISAEFEPEEIIEYNLTSDFMFNDDDLAEIEEIESLGLFSKGGKIFNLDPVDGRKSFYGKAKGINLGNTTQLQSYDTIVAEYDNVNKKMTINDYYSPTTARHINSFLDYYGYPKMSKSEMLAVKGTKFAKGGMVSSNYFSGMLSFLNY
jgi:hypothetical protein